MVSEKNYTENFQWHKAIPEPILANEVHVWRVFTETTSQIKNPQKILSANELERAGKFYFEKDQKRFIMARAMLRMILSHYVGERPQDLRFNYSAFGKPMLETNPGNDNISFNLSHSDGMALYAVTLNRHAGIDVEHMRHNIDIEQIAKRFFSFAENSLINNIHEKDRPAMFLKFWTRKEAIIKATGKGVSFPMDQVDVSSITDNFLSTVKLTDENKKSLYLSVRDLFPEQGYAAAIAVTGDECKITCRHYSP
jgi:4'-phosphopantetheinyl transferase